jgi:hypothetical protein
MYYINPRRILDVKGLLLHSDTDMLSVANMANDARPLVLIKYTTHALIDCRPYNHLSLSFAIGRGRWCATARKQGDRSAV